MARDDFTLDSRRRLNDLLGGAGSMPVSSDTAAWRSWLATPATDGHIPEPPFGLSEAVAPRSPPGIVRGARIDPGRRGAVVLAAVALVAAAVVAVLVWGSRPQAEPLTSLPVVTAEAAPASAAAATVAVEPSPAPVVVSVTGKVARPGLVTVPDGARVADVLAAAGGPLPGVDIATLNLARRIADGEQVAVGVPAAPDALPVAAGAGGSGTGPSAAPGGPVDLNAASVVQLDTLPGVGPVTAQRIVEWRTQHGRFARVEQLREIDGIGERRFEQLRTLVRI